MATITSVDQMGYEIILPHTPRSIVSLVPSQTELLFDLGLDQCVLGVTKFCVHPKDKVRGITKVGGTKNFNFDLIDGLRPDLIIGNKEENYELGIAKLKENYPVWMSDIDSLKDAKEMISSLALLTNREAEGATMVKDIESGFGCLKNRPKKSVLYFIWQNPYMVAGKGTFIDNMLTAIGLENAVDQPRYPELSQEEIEAIDPDLILLSSEPYPFNVQHANEFKQVFNQPKIELVDGEMFSWYGSRLLKAPDYFNSLDF